MSLLDALVLGLVEGITEFLPVSSTGHLILAQRCLGIGAGANATSFAICIQFGAIAAVLGLYRSRVRSIGAGAIGRDAAGAALLGRLLVAFLPAAVAGLLLEDRIERHLFGLPPVVAAWIAGGAAILWLERWRRRRAASAGGAATASGAGGIDLAELRLGQAFAIGLVQCLALWPGTSRSLAAIAGGLLVGLTPAAAVEFSFLLGALTLGAAAAYRATADGSALLAEYGAGPLVLGFAAAAASAAASMRWMVSYLMRHGFGIFGWYRIALGLAVLVWLQRQSG